MKRKSAFVGLFFALSLSFAISVRSQDEEGWYQTHKRVSGTPGYGTLKYAEAWKFAYEPEVGKANNILYVQVLTVHPPDFLNGEITATYFSVDCEGQRYSHKAYVNYNREGKPINSYESPGPDDWSEWHSIRNDPSLKAMKYSCDQARDVLKKLKKSK